MKFYLYMLLGFLGGIPAGMGMGGGTVTIPLLTLVGGVGQKIAQSANLFSFLPMSGFSLSEHGKNGLLKKENIRSSAYMIVGALIFSAAGSLVAFALPSSALRRGFGVFLICLAVYSVTKNKQ